MYVDGGRAPLFAGAPATYAPMAAGGHVTLTTAAPAPAAPAPAAPAAPACAVPAAPQVPPACEDARAANPSRDELIQARQELALYRDELERLRRTVEEIQAVSTAGQPRVAVMPATPRSSRPAAPGLVRASRVPSNVELQSARASQVLPAHYAPQDVVDTESAPADTELPPAILDVVPTQTRPATEEAAPQKVTGRRSLRERISSKLTVRK